MQKQRSAGVVLYRLNYDDEREYLLLKYLGGHWDFPKGKLEGEEDWPDAALRELEEETGLQAVLHDGFDYNFTYCFNDFRGHAIEKEVKFFVGRSVDDREDVQISGEHRAYLWLPFDRAIKQLTFENARELLQAAQLFLEA
jgi:8-oxo-dGTP pyrophosphatase MutT (NUDIX family)